MMSLVYVVTLTGTALVVDAKTAPPQHHFVGMVDATCSVADVVAAEKGVVEGNDHCLIFLSIQQRSSR